MSAPIKMPPMCQMHQYLLVHQCGYGEDDPWRALVIAAQIALFQAMTADPAIVEECGGKVEKLAEVGCHACRKPDAFGEIVEAGKTRDIGAIKRLGEAWVSAASGKRQLEDAIGAVVDDPRFICPRRKVRIVGVDRERGVVLVDGVDDPAPSLHEAIPIKFFVGGAE